jgi:hypothetical protein
VPERSEVDSGLAGDVDIAVDADVRDRVPLADEEIAVAHVLIEQAEHFFAAPLAADGIIVARREPTGKEPEAKAAHRRDHVGLLVDQPANDLRTLERIVGKERRPLAEVEQDRARLRQEAVRGLEHGCRPHRVHGRVLVGEGLAREDVGRHALVRKLELRQQQAHLVAVGRRGVVVEPQRARY